ncbi:hypothetical protein AN1V17_24600 [Vallitalea sediminicola]
MSNKAEATKKQISALLLPVGVLLVAGILLLLGQPGVLNIAFFEEMGKTVFAHLPMIVAIIVAIALAVDDHGTVVLSAVLGYFVLNKGVQTINDASNMGIVAGIIAGIVAGLLYNKYKNAQLPTWLAFFGGKRFVPIVTAFACIILALVFGYAWVPLKGLF